MDVPAGGLGISVGLAETKKGSLKANAEKRSKRSTVVPVLGTDTHHHGRGICARL